jgi:hypothetical protein
VTGAQRVSVVSMVRNEVDVIRCFVAHQLELVNRIVIVDHMSEDGTREVLEEARRADPRIEILSYGFHEYYQSAIITALVRREIRNGSEWVIPLDADEFLAFGTRSELLSVLGGYDSPVKHFLWQNMVPANLMDVSHGEGPRGSIERFFCARTGKPHAKVAVSRSFARRNPLFFVGQGSHHVMKYPGAAPEQGHESGVLYHIPIRSVAQARRKMAVMADSIEATAGRNPADGIHVQQFSEVLQSDQNDDAIRSELVRRAFFYGEKIPAVDPEFTLVSFRPLGGHQLFQPSPSHDAAFAGKSMVHRCRNRSPQTSGRRPDEIRASIRGKRVVIVKRRFDSAQFVMLKLRAAFRLRYERFLSSRSFT